ncbi:MAG: ATP-dependent helicase, partial [Patescibacteria group bacterium]
MPHDQFQKYYQELNKEQKSAVDAIEGPVMVIAGPGTGKTQILTLRIANILAKSDTPAEAILAVTFTEAGVIAMRKRLAEIIGSQAYEVTITTFHGFAHSIIQKYPESFPRIIGSANITEADQVKIMEEVIEGAKGIKILRPFGDRFHYLGDVLHAIQTLKREGISPDDLGKIVEREAKAFTSRDDLFHLKGAHKGKMKGEHKDTEKQIEKNHELAMLYEAYQAALTEQKLYDFEDMIMEVLGAMQSNADLLLQLQEQYQYVLVDEHQDTNNAQNRILELLMSYHDNPNLFIVGDEKQAIFRFQGASLENFHYFKNKFTGAKLITLTQNYRSTQTVLDVAKTNLVAKAGHPESAIQILEAATSDSELYMAVQDIKQKITNKADAAEIAVLYRNNRDALPMARMCDKLGVQYHIESDLDILADPDIRKLVLIFEALQQFGEAEYLMSLLYLDIWGIEPLEVHRFIVSAGGGSSSGGKMAELKKTFPDIYQKLSSWKTVAHNKGLLELFDTIVRDSGLLASFLARPDSVEALEKLGTFLDYLRRTLETHEGATLDDFMASLQRMKEHRILMRGALAGRSPGKIRLMTAHRAKGLEFEHVYIINCFDGHW